jgi:hypothetical protein
MSLPARHTENFFAAERDLGFFAECKKAGFRVFLFFVVDESFTSLKAAKSFQRYSGLDLFVPVRNLLVRSSWQEDDGSLTIPFLAAPVASAIGHRRFSFRTFVQGDMQGLSADMIPILQNFLYETLSNLSNLEPGYSLKEMQR